MCSWVVWAKQLRETSFSQIPNIEEANVNGVPLFLRTEVVDEIGVQIIIFASPGNKLTSHQIGPFEGVNRDESICLCKEELKKRVSEAYKCTIYKDPNCNS